MNTGFDEKVFDAFIHNVKQEKSFYDELHDSEDFDNVYIYKSIENKNKKQQDEMCELASTSYEKDVHVSESNLQVTTLTYFI